MKELLQKAKTTCQIGWNCSVGCSEEEIKHCGFLSKNRKWVLEKDVVEFFKHKAVAPKATYDGQVHVDRKQAVDFADFVESYFKEWEMSYRLQGTSCEIFLAEVIGFIEEYRRKKELLEKGCVEGQK